MINCEQKIWHEKDKEYFNDFSAPVMENSHRLHYTNINSTIPFYGPMLYYLVRAFGCEQVLEIGTAEGYTSFYLANAVRDNSERYQMAGNMFYGVDICNHDVHQHLSDRGLPNDIRYMDSKDLSRDTFKDVRFDFIFQDGDHSTEAVVREFELLWPQLKSGGTAYWVCHDVYGPAEEGCRIIQKRIEEGEFKAEFIRLFSVYGLMLIRKMDDYDYDKRFWVSDEIGSSGK